MHDVFEHRMGPSRQRCCVIQEGVVDHTLKKERKENLGHFNMLNTYPIINSKDFYKST